MINLVSHCSCWLDRFPRGGDATTESINHRNLIGKKANDGMEEEGSRISGNGDGELAIVFFPPLRLIFRSRNGDLDRSFNARSGLRAPFLEGNRFEEIRTRAKLCSFFVALKRSTLVRGLVREIPLFTRPTLSIV